MSKRRQGISRAKTALSGPCSSGGVLGDVDNNGRVDFFDALLVALYSRGSSTVMPNNGDISLGDVNADGRINSTDAYLIAAWLNDPSDPTLPAGIGEGGGGIASPDCAALVALYEATDGDNWTNNANWLSDAPLDEWFGVSTDDDGRVTQLELGGNQLSGVLPSELGNLTHLQVLYLYENELSGSLSSWLGDLAHLRELDLYENDFSGSLPSELGNLTNLEVLYLDRNQLSGPLPLSLINLTYLKWLNLRNTQLCAPLDDVFQGWLEGIENKRGVVNCEEPGDPEDPINPDRAVLVALYEATDGDNWTDNTNWLSDAPLGEWFGVTTDENGRVARLEVGGNGLSGSLPSELSNLAYLEVLHLYDNVLSGSLPSELGNLTNLKELSFSGNQLSGVLPSSLGNLTNLKVLDLDDNALSGSLPSWLGNLTNLEMLQLGNNQFSGVLPSWLGNLTNLTVLALGHSALSGSLPSWLGNLTNLEYLGLHGNQFSGVLPLSLGNLTNLKYLGLFSNELSGSLPSSLINLTSLEYLYLRNTQLCAPLDAAFQAWLEGIENKQGVVNCEPANPDRAVLVELYEATNGDNWKNKANWLSDQPLNAWHGVTTNNNGRVIRLDIRGNDLSGRLPAELGNLTHLQELNLYNNGLSGGLPSELGNLTNLQKLILPNNGLSGELPSSLGNLTNLQELVLYNNGLSGELPSELGNLTNLQKLWLFDTQFSGALPAGLVSLTNLQELHLRNTQLCAPIDASFQRWLEGIPTKSGVVNCEDPSPDRAVLVALYEATNGANWTNNTNWLSDRPLSQWYGVDTNANGRVTHLALGENQLSGKLPRSLGDLAYLQVLALFRNELSGPLPSVVGQPD